MQRQRPGLRFVLPVAPGLRGLVAPIVAQHGTGADIQLLDGQSHAALAACDVTLVASGTAALEAALFKRPMVITYHLAWLNWQRMRRQAYQPWFGLPNILSGEFVVPELIQDAATPEALARAGLAWLDDAPRCACPACAGLVDSDKVQSSINPPAFLNAADRGDVAPNGKPSKTVAEAAYQLNRT
jgi:lipid-A-disaccharide synthase